MKSLLYNGIRLLLEYDLTKVDSLYARMPRVG